MVRFFPAFQLLVLIGFLSSRSESLRFDLQSGHTKCISEDIKQNAMTVGKYHVVNPNEGQPLTDERKLIVRVTSATGNTYHYSDKVESGQFGFVAAEAGDFMACFWAPDHQPQVTLSVDFDWRTGVAAKDWSNVAKKGSVEDKVESPCSLGGLGVEDLWAKNFFFLTKCGGVFTFEHEQNALWRKVVNCEGQIWDGKWNGYWGDLRPPVGISIPKGTATSVKDIRPISLTSSVYKILTEAINLFEWFSGQKLIRKNVLFVELMWRNQCSFNIFQGSVARLNPFNYLILVFILEDILKSREGSQIHHLVRLSFRSQAQVNEGFGIEALKPIRLALISICGWRSSWLCIRYLYNMEDGRLFALGNEQWAQYWVDSWVNNYPFNVFVFLAYVMELELQKLFETANSIQEEMYYLREREEEMQDLNRSTNTKMAWLSLLSLFVCLSVVGLQIWHLKTFFEKKKLI
ncbi:transmembrane emp24 domain-containing protein p24delta9-like [Cucumis melo var. makuwa]|uniref:Transmembrane emp24 domain-containing protein p24delta9-like n=1 Tax=Cucumis melo var. makuwa TaxID=1194695 RepID=A0A5D3CR01_CUCMM|nr:transmembrane emp24 domain-containing protein p24delta9-like [Cucumis melo var. makuwa]